MYVYECQECGEHIFDKYDIEQHMFFNHIEIWFKFVDKQNEKKKIMKEINERLGVNDMKGINVAVIIDISDRTIDEIQPLIETANKNGKIAIHTGDSMVACYYGDKKCVMFNDMTVPPILEPFIKQTAKLIILDGNEDFIKALDENWMKMKKL